MIYNSNHTTIESFDKSSSITLNTGNVSYNGDNGFFHNLILINQATADDYIDIYKQYTEDTYGTADTTVDSYPDWWEKLEQQIKDFLIDLKEAE